MHHMMAHECPPHLAASSSTCEYLWRHTHTCKHQDSPPSSRQREREGASGGGKREKESVVWKREREMEMEIERWR